MTDIDALMSAHGHHTYREFLRVPALSLGLFVAPPGHDDTQQQHQQDEVYLVLGGRAVLDIDGIRTPVGAGSIAYVPARQVHRFIEISDDLRVLVLFAPPEDALELQPREPPAS
ncbi:MAG: cupin domain-containing protein [Actinomycetota bacterium]